MREIHVSRDMTKPATTQINLGIRPVWSESSLCAHWVAKDPKFLHAGSEDSDQTGRALTLLVLSCRSSCGYVLFGPIVQYVIAFICIFNYKTFLNVFAFSITKHCTMLLVIYNVQFLSLSRLTTKPTKWQYAEQRLRSFWETVLSESSLCAQWVAKDPSFLHADSEDWSDWADAQADRESSLGAHAIVLVLSWGGSGKIPWLAV